MIQQYVKRDNGLEDGDRALRLIIAAGLILVVFNGAPVNSAEIFALTVAHIYLVMTALIGIDPLYGLIPLFRRLFPHPIAVGRLAGHA